MEAAIENDVTLSVIDAEYIQILQETAKRMGKKINVHLKVDTGMGRIGVRPEIAPERALFIEKNCPNLHLQGIFTHMPVADMSDLDPLFIHRRPNSALQKRRGNRKPGYRTGNRTAPLC